MEHEKKIICQHLHRDGMLVSDTNGRCDITCATKLCCYVANPVDKMDFWLNATLINVWKTMEKRRCQKAHSMRELRRKRKLEKLSSTVAIVHTDDEASFANIDLVTNDDDCRTTIVDEPTKPRILLIGMVIGGMVTQMDRCDNDRCMELQKLHEVHTFDMRGSISGNKNHIQGHVGAIG